MKNIFFAAFIISAAITGCDPAKKTDDPKIVVEKFIDAASRKDMTTVRSLATADSKFMLDKMENSIKKNDGGLKNFQFDRSKVQIGEATITGDDATVPVKEMKSGESIDLPLRKENGDWKVSLDMSSVMNMAMKKMKEKGINLSDSLRAGMPSLKNLNMDSLKNEMRKKGISIDSIKKEMKKKGITLDSLKGGSVKINIP
jgi:hypothetical protein